MVNQRIEACEMEAFLPRTGTGVMDPSKIDNYHVQIVTSGKPGKDGQTGELPNWDPFKARNVPKPTTNLETLMHLLKACLGTGILAMPFAFKHAGVTFGTIATLVVGLICTHTAYVLVKCAQKLYYRTRVSSLTYPDVGEVAFANGPKFVRIFAKPARLCVVIGIFLTYFGTCSAYAVIICENLKQVLVHHFGIDYDTRYYLMALTIPLILLGWLPNLKALAIFSLVANILMGLVVGIVFYYILFDDTVSMHHPSTLPQMEDWALLPTFFSITIFAMEAIGIMLPLENNMKTPQHFLGACGILNRGMSMVVMIYLALGFLGYLKYGENIQSVISLNLPNEELWPQLAKIFTAVAIFCTYGLQFYVCLELIWHGIKNHCESRPTLYNYLLRTFLVIASVVIALAVPKINTFLSLVGALCFSCLGLIFPVLIEFVVYWEEGFGPCFIRLWKNLFILIFGFLALGFGTTSSVKEIIALYYPEANNTMVGAS